MQIKLIYTTYFAKLKYLPKDIIPISICAKAPDWYTGLQYRKIAPSYDILMSYKSNPDVGVYARRYTTEILNKTTPEQVVNDLEMLTGTFDNIALVCFEKSSDFCHRHIVAEWLILHGYEVVEYDYNK